MKPFLAPELSPAAGSVLDRQFLFIIGAPRSGTSWLQAMMGAHPDVCTSVELTLFDCYLSPWIERWNFETAAIKQGRWHQGLPVLWTEEDFNGFLSEFLAQVYARVLARKPQATHILDKQPIYARHVADIDRLLKGPRFIHLIRDGRDVAVSMVAAHRSMGFGRGDLVSAAAEWKELVLAARTAASFTGRYLEIRYEDLLRDTAGALRQVFVQNGLSASPELVERIVADHQLEVMKVTRHTPVSGIRAPREHFRKGQAGSWAKELGLLQRHTFELVAGDLLRQLGYAPELWWARSRCDRVAAWLLRGMVRANELRRGLFRCLAR